VDGSKYGWHRDYFFARVTKKAPAEMVKLLPALELPAQRAAAPTLKPRVALAILEELRTLKKKP